MEHIYSRTAGSVGPTSTAGDHEPSARAMPRPIAWKEVQKPQQASRLFTPEEINERIQHPPAAVHKLSFKTFVYINCDAKLKDTRFEGDIPTRWSVQLSEFLEQSSQWDPGILPCRLEKAKSLLKDLSIDHCANIRDSQQAEALAKEFQIRISALKPGESFAFHGGYVREKEAHEMVYLVERAGNHTYSFTVVNSGDGIRFHPTIVDGVKQKFDPGLRFKGLDLTHLNIHFLQGLIQINSPIAKDALSEDALYLLIMANLYDVPYESANDIREFITAQRSGTCALKAQLALLRIIFGESTFKNLIRYMCLDSVNLALSGFFDAELKKTDLDGQIVRDLTRFAANHLLHLSTKQLEKSPKDDGPIRDAILSALALLEKVDRCEADVEEALKVIKEIEPVADETLYPKRIGELKTAPFTVNTDFPSLPLPKVFPPSRHPTISDILALTNLEKSLARSPGAYALQIELYANSLSTPNAFLQPPDRSIELIQALTDLLKTYVDKTIESSTRVAKQRNTARILFAHIHALCKIQSPDLARQFGISDIISETDAGQLFLSQNELDRHNELLIYTASSNQALNSNTWTFNHNHFDPSTLPPLLHYVYSEIFIPNRSQIIHFLSQAGFNVGSSVKEFVSFFTLDGNFELKSPLVTEFALLRSIQRAHISINVFEKKFGNTRNYRLTVDDRTNLTTISVIGNDNTPKVVTLKIPPQSMFKRYYLAENVSTSFEVSEHQRTNLDATKAVDLKDTLLGIFRDQAYDTRSLKPIHLIELARRFFAEFDSPILRSSFEHQLFKAPVWQYSPRAVPIAKALCDTDFKREFFKFLDEHRALLMLEFVETRLDLALFLIRLATHTSFLSLVEAQETDYRTKLNIFVLEFLDSLKKNPLSADNQAKLFLHAALFQTVLLESSEKQNVIDLLDAWLQFRQNPIVGDQARAELDYLSTTVSERFFLKLPSLVDQLRGRESEFSMRIFGELGEFSSLEGSRLTLKNTGGCALVCFMTGSLMAYGKEVKSPFPVQQFFLDSNCIELFGEQGKNLTKSTLHAASFFLEDAKGHYRVTYSGESSRRTSPFLIEKYHETLGWLPYINRNRLLAIYKTIITENYINCDIPLGILAGCEAWEDSHGLVHFSDMITGKFLYFENEGKVLCQTGTNSRVQSLKGSCAFSIENSSFVHIETATDGTEKLCFPRYNDLSFVRNPGDSTWYWTKDNSFFLSLETVGNELHLFDNYLRIESLTGQCFALIPNLTFASKKPHFNLHRCKQYDYRNPPEKPPTIDLGQIHTFAIPIKDGQLCPVSSEQVAFCAYINLGIRRYDAALERIQEIGPIDLIHSAACVEGMKKLSQFALGQATSPEGIGIGLKAVVVLSRAGPDNPPDIAHYQRYLGQLGNIPREYRITAEEELSIITSVPPHARTLQLMNREHLLLGGYSPPDSMVSCVNYNPKQPEIRLPTQYEIPFSTADTGRGPVFDLSFSNWQREVGKLSTFYRTADSFSSVYNTTLLARGNIEKKRMLNSLLVLSLVLCPETRKNTSLFYHILHNPPSGEARFVFYTPGGQNDPYALGASLFSYFKIPNGCSLTLKVSQPKQFSTRIELEGRIPYPQVLALPNNPKVREGERLQIDPSRVWTFFDQELSSAKRFVLNAEQRRVRFAHEEDHFLDPDFFMPDEDPSLKAPQEKMFTSFSDGYKENLKHRESQTIAVLTLAEIETEILAMKQARVGREERLITLENELLTLANKRPEEAFLLEDLVQGSSARPPLTIKNLQFLFFNGQVEGYKTRNPYLTDIEIVELHHLSAIFFKASVEAHQLERLQSLLEELSKKMATPNAVRSVTSESLDRDGVVVAEDHHIVDLLHKLRKTAKQTSAYDLREFPERLAFEFETRKMFLCEPDQEAALLFLIERVKKGQNGTLQVGMGGGKTDVIAAYFMAKMASMITERQMFPVLMTPAFQLQSVSHALKKKLEGAFDIELVTIEPPHRGMELVELEAIEKRLREIKDSQQFLSPKVLLIGPEYFQVLELEYYLHYEYVSSLDPDAITDEEIAKLRCLTTLLDHIRDTVILCDEAHVSLDTNLEVNFPKGEPEKYDPKFITLISFIHQVLNKPELLSLLHLSTNEQTKHFSMEIYQTRVLPLIAEALSKYEEIYLQDETKRKSLLRYLKGELSPILQQYLDNRPLAVPAELQEDFDFLLYLKDLEESGDPELMKAVEMIDKAKELLQSLIPFVLANKTINIHCGRSRIEKAPGETVPYICADTPSKNKFGSVELLVVLHFLTAMIHGVEDGQITQLFEKFEKDALFATSILKVPYESSSAVKRCRQLFGIAPCELKDHFDEIRQKVKADSELVFEVERFTAEQYAVTFSERANSNAMSIVSLGGLFYAMSGTPPIGLFHHSLQKHTLVDRTVNPAVIHALISKQTPFTIVDIAPDNPYGSMIQAITQDSNVRGILDVRSYFKDIPNDEVARLIIKHTSPEVKAVLYFTRQGGSAAADFPAILLRNETEPKILREITEEELEKHDLKKGEFFTFFSRRQTEGIDIPALGDACYAILPGSQMSLSESTQAAKRLRALFEGQNVHPFIDREEAHLLDPSFEKLPTVDQYRVVTKKALKVEARLDAQKKLTAYRKMLSNAVVSHLRQYLLSLPISTKPEVAAQASKFRQLKQFIFVDDRELKKQCRLEDDFDVLDVLKAEAASLIQSVEENGNIPREVAQNIKREINEEILTLAEKTKVEFVQKVKRPVLSPKSAQSLDTEILAQRQVDQETKLEVDQELQKEVEQEILSLQGTPFLQERPTTPFNPREFIIDQLTNFATPKTSISVSSAFSNDPCVQKGHNYGALFLPNLQITDECLRPYTNQISFFSRKRPPLNYLVIFYDVASSTYKGVIVTRSQAEHLTNHLRETKQDNIWVVHPNLEIQAGASPINFENDTLQQLMIPFNLLGGNLDYPFKYLVFYKDWFDMDPDLDQLKKRFLYLTHTKYQPLLLEHHLMLANAKEIDRIIYTESSTGLLEDAQKVAPEEVTGNPEKFKRHIPYFRGAPLVQAIPNTKEFMDLLVPQQMAFISISQAEMIQSIRCVRKFPENIIANLPLAQLQRHLRHLLPTQLAFIKDPNILRMVDKHKWKSLSPDIFAQARIVFADFDYLSDAQFVKLPVCVEKGDLPAVQTRCHKIVDPSVLFEFLSRKAAWLLEKQLACLTNPLAVNFVTSNNIRFLQDGLLRKSCLLPECQTQLQSFTNAQTVDRLWELGFRNFTSTQFGAITDKSIFSQFNAEFARKVVTLENCAPHLDLALFTKEFFERGPATKIATSLLIKFSALQVGWYLDQWPTGSDQFRYLSIDVIVHVRSKNPFTLTEGQIDQIQPKHYSSLSDALLNSLKSAQIAKIADPDLIRRLDAEHALYVNPIYADHIVNSFITQAAIQGQIGENLSLKKIRTFNDKLLKDYVTARCNSIWSTYLTASAKLLQQVTDKAFLVRLQIAGFPHFTDEQMAIIDPTLSPDYYTKEVLDSTKRLLDLKLLRKFSTAQLEWYLNAYPEGVELCKRLPGPQVVGLQSIKKIILTDFQLGELTTEDQLLLLSDENFIRVKFNHFQNLQNLALLERMVDLVNLRRLTGYSCGTFSPGKINLIGNDHLQELSIQALYTHFTSEKLATFSDQQIGWFVKTTGYFFNPTSTSSQQLRSTTDLGLLRKLQNAGFSRFTTTQLALLAPPVEEACPESAPEVSSEESDESEITAQDEQILLQRRREAERLRPPPEIEFSSFTAPRKSPSPPLIIDENTPPGHSPHSSHFAWESRPWRPSEAAAIDEADEIHHNDQQKSPITARRGHSPAPIIPWSAPSPVVEPDHSHITALPPARQWDDEPAQFVSPPARQWDASDQLGYLSVDALKAYIKRDHNHANSFRRVQHPDVLSRIIQAGYLNLTRVQIQRLRNENDLLLLPEKLLSHLTPKQISALKNPKLIAKLGPTQVSHINPKYVGHLRDESIKGVNDKQIVAGLSLRQIRHLEATQLKQASYSQALAYTVMTFAEAFFALLLFPLVELIHWTSHIVCLCLFEGAHKYTLDKIGKLFSLNLYFAKRVLCCA